MSLQSLISTYGYFAVGIGTLVEGEFMLLLAALAARRGYLDIRWVILTAIAGSVTGDQVVFILSRRKGTRLLERSRHWERKTKKVREWVERHRILLMLTFRFVTGVR